VVRAWKARLGGADTPLPHFASYGTENGPHSANAELAPPPGLTELIPGDFIEAEIELIVLPQSAGDYYGPNAALKTVLAEHAGTWKLTQRFAREGALQIAMREGALARTLPVEIAVDPGTQSAACEITGGVGYVPITFTGLNRPKGFTLRVDGEAIDQSVHGNDYWQVVGEADGTWSVTYNLLMDGARVRNLVFGGL